MGGSQGAADTAGGKKSGWRGKLKRKGTGTNRGTAGAFEPPPPPPPPPPGPRAPPEPPKPPKPPEPPKPPGLRAPPSFDAGGTGGAGAGVPRAQAGWLKRALTTTTDFFAKITGTGVHRPATFITGGQVGAESIPLTVHTALQVALTGYMAKDFERYVRWRGEVGGDQTGRKRGGRCVRVGAVRDSTVGVGLGNNPNVTTQTDTPRHVRCMIWYDMVQV